MDSILIKYIPKLQCNLIFHFRSQKKIVITINNGTCWCDYIHYE